MTPPCRLEIFAVGPPAADTFSLRMLVYSGRGMGSQRVVIAQFTTWTQCVRAAAKLAELFGKKSLIVNHKMSIRTINVNEWKAEPWRL